MRLRTGALECASQSSPTSTLTSTRSQAVLAAIDAEAPDAVWCLGDLVGYGPRPNECCSRGPASAPTSASSATTTSLALGTEALDADFNPDASASRRVDAGRCSTSGRGASSRASSPQARLDGRELFHGEPARPGLGVRAQRRGGAGDVRADRGAARPRRPQPRPARHIARRATSSRARTPRAAPRSTSPPAAGCCNPGSVGQPRDGDPRAAWLLLDLDARHSVVSPRALRHRRRRRRRFATRAARVARRAARARRLEGRAVLGDGASSTGVVSAWPAGRR